MYLHLFLRTRCGCERVLVEKRARPREMYDVPISARPKVELLATTLAPNPTSDFKIRRFKLKRFDLRRREAFYEETI